MICGTMTDVSAAAHGFEATSRSFERELCRALAAAGFTGPLELVDANTGLPRVRFSDLVQAGRLTARENDRRGPHYAKFVEMPDVWPVGAPLTQPAVPPQ